MKSYKSVTIRIMSNFLFSFFLYNSYLLNLEHSGLQKSVLCRRDTYRRADWSTFTFFTCTPAQSQRTLQTQRRESQADHTGGHESRNVWKDRSLQTYPFICQRRLWSKKHKNVKMLLHLLHVVELQPTKRHLQNKIWENRPDSKPELSF